MTPDNWTELFFLDEATAFAAGHRPCFQCRYPDHRRFKTAWLKGNPQYAFNEKTSIQEIDLITHNERIDRNRDKITYNGVAGQLPDGTFIQLDEKPYLVANNKIYHWTPFGYDKGLNFDKLARVIVLTPLSTVNAFGAGYRPQMAGF